MSIDGTLRLPHTPAPTEGSSGGLYDVLTGAQRPEPGAGPALLQQCRDLGAALEKLPAALTQLGDEQLTDLMGVLMRVQARAGHVATLTAADATERGTVLASDAANTQQWVTGCATAAEVSLEPRDAKTMTVVAQGCREQRNHVVTAAVRDGACTLLTARRVLDHTGKVAKVLPTATREEIQSWFLQLDSAHGARGVDELTRALRARFGPEELEADDAHLEDVESLTWSKLATGMWRLIAELSPANAALLKQAITALSAPGPAKNEGEAKGAHEGEGTSAGALSARPDATDSTRGTTGYGGSFGPIDFGEGNDWFDNDADRDGSDCGHSTASGDGARVGEERLPGKRRLDALMELVAAGAKVAHGDGTGLGAAATLLVTMDLAALLTGVGEATTITGDVLDPGTARRLACDADLVPVVLGGKSQPLDVGRRERLVTKGMRAAVVFRDRGCTFPGCDRPPGFCEVHHLQPWWSGGPTCLSNSALLCRRHHQIVHRKGYYATVSAEGVSWNRTVGAMPGWTPYGYRAAAAAS